MYVLMVVPSDFPEGDAGAIRDQAFAKIYRELGYESLLIGMGRNENEGEFGDIKFYSLYKQKKNVLDHIVCYVKYKKRCAELVNRIIEHKGLPALIHINDIPEGMINFLTRIAIKENIPIIHDSTEWYSACEFKLGKYDKAYILKNRLNKKVIRQPIRVVAISSYLENHFKKKKIATVRMPVVMDVTTIDCGKRKVKQKINMIYAGSPTGKDYLKEIIDAVSRLSDAEQGKITLHVLGIKKEQLKQLCKTDEMPECINVYGRVTRDVVLAMMKNMDFALLLRPENERYAKAGFPTKVVEALSCGVAMICNVTSDLGLYLHENHDAIFVSECSTDAMIYAFRKMLKLSHDEICMMKRNARKTAETWFDYRGYVDEIKRLIDDV